MNKHAGKRSPKAMRKAREHDARGRTGVRNHEHVPAGEIATLFERGVETLNSTISGDQRRRARNRMPGWAKEITKWEESEATAGIWGGSIANLISAQIWNGKEAQQNVPNPALPLSLLNDEVPKYPRRGTRERHTGVLFTFGLYL